MRKLVISPRVAEACEQAALQILATPELYDQDYGALVRKNKKYPCGSPSCALGWIAHYLDPVSKSDPRDVVSAIIGADSHVYDDDASVVDALNRVYYSYRWPTQFLPKCPKEKFRDSFDPAKHITPELAAARIRFFAKTGK